MGGDREDALRGDPGVCCPVLGKELLALVDCGKKQSQTPLDTTINSMPQWDGVGDMTLIFWTFPEST